MGNLLNPNKHQHGLSKSEVIKALEGEKLEIHIASTDTDIARIVMEECNNTVDNCIQAIKEM